jgi:predicted dinucleotide-binding enzyme
MCECTTALTRIETWSADHTLQTREVSVRIGVIGTGRIGGLHARLLAMAGHEVMLSFSRHPERLQSLAAELGVSVGSAREAIAFADVVLLSIPWDAFPELSAQVGDFRGKIIIDTSNAFGSTALPPPGMTTASFNAARLPQARYTKSFNTLTAGFQTQTAGRQGGDRVVQWLCGDDLEAKRVVAALIEQIGFAVVDVGGNADAAIMESPRRRGAVYGEEYRQPEASQVVAALRAGRPLPDTPAYGPRATR